MVALDGVLTDMDMSIDHVLNIDVPKEVLIERAVGRRVCKACGATYHVMYNSPSVRVCATAAVVHSSRGGRQEETVVKRIEVYLEQTKPLIDYYSEKGLLISMDGGQE